MEEKRSERENEFAPPQFYYDKQPTARKVSSAQHTLVSSNCTNPTVPAASSIGNNTDTMLKQIRNSVGMLPQAFESVGHVHMKSDPRENDNKRESTNGEANINLAAIPMPDDRLGSGDTHALSANVQTKREADPPASCERDEVSGMNVRNFQWQDQPFLSTGQGQEYVESQGHFQPMPFCGPVPNVSVPPPGWYPPQSQALPQQPAGEAGPWLQSSAPSTSSLAGPSAHPEQSHACMLPFMYPSQQGLNTQLQQYRSTSQEKVISPTAQPPATKTITMATVPKVNMVDKRFMQNREVSDEDLLGYMANASADSLAKVEPVSYTPGIFSSAAAAAATRGRVNSSDSYNSGTGSYTQVGEVGSSSAQGQRDSNRWTPPTAVQTEGVIFGVPDFLQPACDVTAKTYQPGSFMAAKAAAAQKAEEEYKVAREKKQYSSAAVLYSRLDDG